MRPVIRKGASAAMVMALMLVAVWASAVPSGNCELEDVFDAPGRCADHGMLHSVGCGAQVVEIT